MFLLYCSKGWIVRNRYMMNITTTENDDNKQNAVEETYMAAGTWLPSRSIFWQP